jgi:hypothetical protein
MRLSRTPTIASNRAACLAAFIVFVIAYAMTCGGCNPSIVVIPNGTVVRIADPTPVTVATYDKESKSWIVRGKIVVNGYYAVPPTATTQPTN